jgi:hypothetical protein
VTKLRDSLVILGPETIMTSALKKEVLCDTKNSTMNILTHVFSLLCNSSKFKDGTLNRPRPLPSLYFTIHFVGTRFTFFVSFDAV